MKCERPYNANGESTSVTTVSSTGVVNNTKLLRRGKEFDFNRFGKTLDGKEDIVRIVKQVCDSTPGLSEICDWTWILAFAGQESGWLQKPPKEGSYKGLFQISNTIFKTFCSDCGGDIHNIENNAKSAVKYFIDNYKNYVKNTQLSQQDKIYALFICHNAGQGAFKKFYNHATEKTFNGLLNSIMTITQSEFGYYTLDNGGNPSKREEIHNFPLEANGFHNYVLDWLSKHSNI